MISLRCQAYPRKAASLVPTVAILFAVLALASPAQAANNRTDLRLLTGAEKRLGADQVRLVSTGLARGRGVSVWLPVVGGKVAAAQAVLNQGGGIRIRAKRSGAKARSLHLARLQLRIGKKRSVLTARSHRREANRPWFILRHGPRALALNPARKRAVLRGARLVPTALARATFRRELGIEARALPIARLTVTADLTAFDFPEIPPPPLVPLPPEPERLARPESAVDILEAQVTWCARASWVRYIGNGILSGGATAETPFVVNNNAADFARVCDHQKKNVKPSSGANSYRYYFPFKEGWYDPVSGKAALYFTGTVGFRYPLRGIDLDFSDLEVEIDGAASRSIFLVSGRGDSLIAPTRVVFAENGNPVPTLKPAAGGRLASNEMPSYLPEATSLGVFAGNYMAPDNNDFGWISVDFKPQPDA